MGKVLVINGSYRANGITDQILAEMVEQLVLAGEDVEMILLRDYPIEFCLNCRECTQNAGISPGKCVQQDGMIELVRKIEKASCYILASPTNFGSVTAIYKRFMERLIVYAHWPWGIHFPRFRKESTPRKKAIIISSCAAPGIIGRFLYSSHKQLKMTAKMIGAVTVGKLFIGFMGEEVNQSLPKNLQQKVKKFVKKIL